MGKRYISSSVFLFCFLLLLFSTDPRTLTFWHGSRPIIFQSIDLLYKRRWFQEHYIISVRSCLIFLS